MKYCKIKKLIKKDINSICFSLSNPDEYDLTETFSNIKAASDHAKILVDTIKSNIEYKVKINDLLVNLWTAAEEDADISSKISTYGKDKYMAAVLVYFSAKYNTIFVSNNIKLSSCSCNLIKCNVNLIEHRVEEISSNKVSNLNSYNLVFYYKTNYHGFLKKTEWNINYEYLQSDTVQQDFIDACKTSWVNSVLLGMS